MKNCFSTDGGKTFSNPVALNDLTQGPHGVIGADPFVGPNGEVYVAWNTNNQAPASSAIDLAGRRFPNFNPNTIKLVSSADARTAAGVAPLRPQSMNAAKQRQERLEALRAVALDAHDTTGHCTASPTPSA